MLHLILLDIFQTTYDYQNAKCDLMISGNESEVEDLLLNFHVYALQYLRQTIHCVVSFPDLDILAYVKYLNFLWIYRI